MLSLRVVKSSFYVFVGLVISVQLFACGNPHPPKAKAPAAGGTVAAEPPADLSANAAQKPAAQPVASPKSGPVASPAASAKPSASPNPNASALPSPAPTVAAPHQWFQPLQIPANPAAPKFEDKLGLCATLQPNLAPSDATQLKEIFDGSAGSYILSDVVFQHGLKDPKDKEKAKWNSLTQSGSGLKTAAFKEICRDVTLDKTHSLAREMALPRSVNRQTGAIGQAMNFTSKLSAVKDAMKVGDGPKVDTKGATISIVDVALAARKAGWEFYVTPLSSKRSFEVFMRNLDEKTGELITVQATYQLSL